VADESNLRHVVDMDLSKCFDTLNHELILAGLRERITDGSILELVRQFLQSGVMVGNGWEATEEGSPQRQESLLQYGIRPEALPVHTTTFIR
jgi:retron-type reverse transcriptase